MLVLRGATLVFACLLIATGVSAVDQGHYLNALKARPAAAPAAAPAPAQFKQQAKAEANAEAAMKVKLSRTQSSLEHENKLLAMQQEEAQLLQKLKATTLARERAEESLVHDRLLVSQRETSRLVNQLAHMSTHRMMSKLQTLSDILTKALQKPTAAAKPSSIAIDSKLMQKKQEPAAGETDSADKAAATEGAGADAATPTSGPESEAKKKLHKQLVAKAADVVSAQLDGILNSEELAYIKAHNELGDSDSEQTEDGDIEEEDRGARPGETPDEHYKRLSKEADALMAKAYPFIRCEGGAEAHSGGASGASGESSTGETGGTGSSGEGSTGETGETAGTGSSGATGEEASSTAESTAAGGLLEAGATGETTGAAEPAAGTAGETAAAPGEAASTAEAAPPADAAPPAEAAPPATP